MKIKHAWVATLAAVGMAGVQAAQAPLDSQQFVFGGSVAMGDTFSYSFTVTKAGELDGSVFGISGDLGASFQWMKLDGTAIPGMAGPFAGAKTFSLLDYAITAGAHTVTLKYNYDPLFAPSLAPGNGTVLGSLTYTAAPVPEPESLALMLAGLGALGLSARRRKLG